MTSVFFTPWKEWGNMFGKFRKLLEASGVVDHIQKGDLVAIKLHVGELGNPHHLKPGYVRYLVDAIIERGGKPFITDTTTYYKASRHNALDHHHNARMHGFTYETTHAPFIVADGLGFEEGIVVPTEGEMESVHLAQLWEQVDKVIVFSHCKGHPQSAFGGAIKNIAMGCATKAGKLEQHRMVGLEVDLSKCDGCGVCLDKCPDDFPVIENGARITSKESEECMRCPICHAECPTKAIELVDRERMPKALASTAKAFLDLVGTDNVSYISMATNITWGCDCFAAPGEIIAPDIGIFASNDIVAIEKAFLDKAGTEVFEKAHGLSPLIEVEEAARLGLGKLEYQLMEL